MIWIRNFGVQLLTVEESVVIPDSRISIQHATGANDWNLVIKDVKPDDAGKYVCEVYGYSIRKMVLLQVNAVNGKENKLIDGYKYACQVAYCKVITVRGMVLLKVINCYMVMSSTGKSDVL